MQTSSTLPKELRGLDLKEMRDELEQRGKDVRRLASLRPKLRAEHPDHWVAVYKGKVVGITPDLKELFNAVEEQGIPKGKVALTYLAKEPRRLLL